MLENCPVTNTANIWTDPILDTAQYLVRYIWLIHSNLPHKAGPAKALILRFHFHQNQ